MTLSHDPFSDRLPVVPYFDNLLLALSHVSQRPIKRKDQIKWHAISGGDINQAFIITLPNGERLFMKQNQLEALPLLKSEWIGLQAIALTGARCSQPLAFGKDDQRSISFLLLSVIDSDRSQNAGIQTIYPKKDTGWVDLANQLAILHLAPPPQPQSVVGDNNKDYQSGWIEDNFIGRTPQLNNWLSDWHEFFATNRLGFQIKLALDQGYLDHTTLRQLEKVQQRLGDYLPNYDRPSLLHGDLWSGNALIDAQGRGYLIDPAVYVGHPETDIAMSKMFGGFDSTFYDAYADHIPLLPDFAERIDLYNLYHYLNHLNLFGSSYLAAVKRIAKRFAGTSS